jgi:hypothetical protein
LDNIVYEVIHIYLSLESDILCFLNVSRLSAIFSANRYMPKYIFPPILINTHLGYKLCNIGVGIVKYTLTLMGIDVALWDESGTRGLRGGALIGPETAPIIS